MVSEKPTVDAVFLAAADLPPDQRPAYLDRACGEDVALRARVDRLLAAQLHGASFLDAPAPELGATADRSVEQQPGDQIGPFTLLEQIGEGGFGVVFLAEQQRPVRRKVALKVIKPGMDTREVFARFEAERQALALMDHPNIAKVLDAGTTGEGTRGEELGARGGENASSGLASRASQIAPFSGRPYFVMELVQGVPITEYCDQCNLPTRERLELFITVCQAVQHAHQKGIIHRDLKPSNVLVTMQDGKPAPKIIDFGVAKAIGEQTLSERTLTTAFAQMIGSPLYMSPEQAELSPLGVDTRSDIYSLGVLLYELLTGSTPFDKDRLHEAHYDELRRIIRDEEPPRPSARLSTLKADLATTIAEHRRTDSRRLSQTIRGELDWIVMQCLEKDRGRRYDSAGSLARDVERYLADEPVQACPPSRTYRFKKYLRRNKTAAAFLALLGVSVAALALINLQLVRERDAKSAALEQAIVESARTQAVSDALRNILGSSYPHEIKDATFTLRQVLDDLSAKLHYQTEGQPEIEAAIRTMLGQAYWRLGIHERAEENLQRAVELHRNVYGDSDFRVAGSLVDRAWNLGDLRRFADAKACAQEAAEIYAHLGANAQADPRRADALYIVAMAQLELGDVPGYRRTCETLITVRVSSLDVVLNSRPVWPCCLVPDALDEMNRLTTRAEQFFEENSARLRHYCLQVLGAAYLRAGRFNEAAPRLEESIRLYPARPESGVDNLNYPRLLLAMTKWNLGAHDEARTLLDEVRVDVDQELRAPRTLWNRRTTLELLLREADGLIRPQSSEAAASRPQQDDHATTARAILDRREQQGLGASMQSND